MAPDLVVGLGQGTEAEARWIHREYHRGTPQAQVIMSVALDYARRAKPGRQWAEFPRPNRWIIKRIAAILVRGAWGAKYCRTDKKYTICHERP